MMCCWPASVPIATAWLLGGVRLGALPMLGTGGAGATSAVTRTSPRTAFGSEPE